MREETTKAFESKEKQTKHVVTDDERRLERGEEFELNDEQLSAVSGGLSMEITGDTSERPR